MRRSRLADFAAPRFRNQRGLTAQTETARDHRAVLSQPFLNQAAICASPSSPTAIRPTVRTMSGFPAGCLIRWFVATVTAEWGNVSAPRPAISRFCYVLGKRRVAALFAFVVQASQFSGCVSSTSCGSGDASITARSSGISPLASNRHRAASAGWTAAVPRALAPTAFG